MRAGRQSAAVTVPHLLYHLLSSTLAGFGQSSGPLADWLGIPCFNKVLDQMCLANVVGASGKTVSILMQQLGGLWAIV